MSESLILVLATIWSLFVMYLIVWKLKINKFEEQMQSILESAMEDYLKKLKARSELAMEQKAADLIKNVLVEARVIDRRVELIFKKKEEDNSNLDKDEEEQ